MKAELSPQDQNVLNSVFKGTHLSQAPVIEIDETLQSDRNVSNEVTEEITKLERAAVKMAQDGDTKQAKEIFDTIVFTHPLYASAYNNRAQLRRITGTFNEDILADLHKAIDLAAPGPGETEISPMRALVLRHAYDQLSAIYLEESRKPENAEETWDLQLKASHYMLRASEFGETVAVTLAARMNPYAKLCGSMVELCMGNITSA